MDLDTIKAKLSTPKVYNQLLELVEDFKLLISNAIEYYPVSFL